MASTIPLDIYAGKFPANLQSSPFNLFKGFLRRLKVTLPGDRVFVGRRSISNPLYNAGIWFLDLGDSSSALWAWNNERSKYEPQVYKIASGNNEIVFGAPAVFTQSTRFVALPDASGTAQMLRDIYVPRATIIIGKPTPVTAYTVKWTATDPFDGSSSGNYLHRLTGDTTYSFSNLADGVTVTMAIENFGTTFDVDFPVAVQWPVGGTEPTQPPATTGVTALGIWTFQRINGTIYGNLQNATPGNPQSQVPVGGSNTVPVNYGQGNSDPAKFPY